MGSHDALPDAILELVFLGLDSLVSLHRAASACKRWRRIIASAAFRALHSTLPPVVAGSYYNNVIFRVRPRFEPSPSAAAAAAVDRRHFSLDFLPGGNHCNKWLIKDSHGSLLLLVRRDWDWRMSRDDLIVCEPLTQRHEVLPRPPMAPLASYWGATAVLLADDDDVDSGGGGMSKFKVLCVVDDDRPHGSLHAYLFTSGRGGSTCRTSSIAKLQSKLTFIGIATGRRYWHDQKKKVFALDESTLEFSSFVVPDDDNDDDDDRNARTVLYNMVALTIGRDGEARIAVGGGIAGSSNIKIFARVQRCGDGNGEKWELEKTVQLSMAKLGLPRLGYFYLSCNLPVEAGKLNILLPALGTWFFRLDMETMEAERLPERDKDYLLDYKKSYPFEFPWPSLLGACCTDDKA
ncbi:unnamed protein product [Urochloa humidicola]